MNGDEQAQAIAEALAEKPRLLGRVFRKLRNRVEDGEPVRVASHWVHADGEGFMRYNLLGLGDNEVGYINESHDGWVWVAHYDPPHEMSGRAPDRRRAADAVDHFLVLEGWTLSDGDLPEPREQDEEDEELEELARVLASQNDEDDGEDIPF